MPNRHVIFISRVCEVASERSIIVVVNDSYFENLKINWRDSPPRHKIHLKMSFERSMSKVAI